MVAWRLAFGVWRRDRCLGVVWRSAMGYGFAVGFVWVCCGLRWFGSAWVSLGGCRHGFHLRLSAWTGGGMVMGTMIG